MKDHIIRRGAAATLITKQNRLGHISRFCFFVMETGEGKLERGELLFTYRLGKPGLGYGRKQYNDKISGMTILGEVLSTERETVRLKLDIDEGWNPGGPYAYTWRPETGNMMYCMPQAGTRVSLYFPNYDEQAAMAVNCVRTNGSSCDRMSDPSRRSFVTEHGKEMNLYPQEMSLLGGANGTVKLEDETGIAISTDKKITVVAQGKVFISAKTATGAAPIGEIVMAKRNVLADETESSLVQSNQYDLLSADYTHMEGRNQQTFDAYDDAPQEGKFDWSGLIGNVLAGLAVVGAVALTLATFGAAAPVIIGAVAVGTTAVIGQAMSDYASGTVSSVGTYMMTGFMGAVAGAVSGGVGSLIEGAIPAGATALTKMGIVGGSGVVETLIENTIMGQETTGTDMIFAFVASAGLFGIGDNLLPILKRSGQAFGGMLDNATKYIDDVLGDIGKQLDTTLDNLSQQIDNLFKDPYAPVLAMEGPPLTGQVDDFVDSISRQIDQIGGMDDAVRRTPHLYGVSDTDIIPNRVPENIITDGSHLENGRLKPNVTYSTGEHGYIYTTNEDGLIESAYAENLQLKTHEGRLNHNPNTYGKQPGDHAGHIFGDRFGGSPELDNLVSQASQVNLSQYKIIENRWQRAIEAGQSVTVDIKINYAGGSARPISFEVTYTIDGRKYHEFITN